MSNKHPKLTAKQIIKILETKGFYFSRQNGSHAIYTNQGGIRTTVPIHGKKTLGIGLLKQIMKDTNLVIDDLKEE